MPRLIFAALAAALLGLVVVRLLGALRTADLPGRWALGRKESPMQRTAFLLLVALVFYAALWGG